MDIQNLYKDITLKLAKHFGIVIHHGINNAEFDVIINDTGKSSAPKTFIKHGELYLHADATWSLAIHELLHIAVVEPEYRNVITHDTQDIYSKINEKYPDRKKFRSESSTLGLQYHVYKHFDLIGSLFGGFFSGAIRKRDNTSNIPSMWRDKGELLFYELGIEKVSL